MIFQKLLSIKYSLVLFGISIFFGVYSIYIYATEIEDLEIINPSSTVQKVLDEKFSEITSLTETTLDEDEEVEIRLSAINKLSGIYFDHLLANSEVLVNSDSPEVAIATMNALGGFISMLPGHHHAGDETENIYASYQNQVVDKSLNVLRMGLDHSDIEVRNAAAPILSARADETSLTRIQELIDSNMLNGALGINYISLAPTEVASPYIEKYATSGNADMQAAALDQLSYNSDYTELVRGVALDPDTASKAVSSALRGLAITDSEYPNYSLKLAGDKKLSKDVRAAAIEGTVLYTIRNKTSQAEVQKIIPVLSETAAEIKLEKTDLAVDNLKETYKIQ